MTASAPSGSHNTRLRREAIRSMILSERIGTQVELTEKLKAAGFPATQSTVSRDIRELRLIKLSDRNGRFYCLPQAKTEPLSEEQFSRLYRSVAKRATRAMNLVVIRTEAGMAAGLGAFIERMELKGVSGTLAGDDTLLIITESEAHAAAVSKMLPPL